MVTQRVGGCPRLQSLRLESCDGLRSVALRHSRVKELRLTGCKRLVSVALHCPKLSELDLDECGELLDLRLRQVRGERGRLGGWRMDGGVHGGAPVLRFWLAALPGALACLCWLASGTGGCCPARLLTVSVHVAAPC